MLSKLQSASNQLFWKLATTRANPNIVSKRWSGHNAMHIVPSSSDRLYLKNWMHFYFLMASVPVALFTFYLHIRANPELTEIPEGYQPRDWEYYRHPVTRWMAKNLFKPMEFEHELNLAMFEDQAEGNVILRAEKRVKEVMAFYNDHRSLFYEPFYADYYRIGRDATAFNSNYAVSNINEYYEAAHDPDVSIVPVEGYVK